MKLLVTGADGFIGSHLTEQLILRGYNVRALVYYNSFNNWGWLEHLRDGIADNIEIVSGDVRDAFMIKNALSGCDAVLHLASLIAIPYSYHAPAAYVDTNITGTLHVLQAARELAVDRVIHTSTSEVYGTAQYVPIDEKHPLHAQSPYAATKIAADQLVMSYHYSFGTPVTIVRPFNTYGPRQSARAVLPTVITQIAAGRRSIKLGTLHPTRDFSYVEDTVRGFISALESGQATGQVINIGSNFEISIETAVRLIAELMDVSIEIETSGERLRPSPSEVERLWADNAKAKRILGWEPLYGGLEGFKKGLRKTIEWFIDPVNLQKYKSHIYNV